MLSSNNVSEELVLSSLRVSPLMNPLFTPDGSKMGILKCFSGLKVGAYI